MTTSAESNITPPNLDSINTTTNKEECQWAMFCHLSVFLGMIIPFANLIAPFILWQIKKSEMPFVADQGKEVVNFQITVLLAMLVCFILAFVLIGFVLMFIVGVFALVVTIIGAIKANDGENYRYPLTLRLLK